MPLIPSAAGCAACGGGASTPGVDVEDLILCDYVAGEIVGSAIAVYEYDDAGVPTGPPTFVVPGTNTPYVVQGTLQACAPETCNTVLVEELCDFQPDGVTVPFRNTLNYACDGTFISSSYTTALGTPYVPTGTIGICTAAEFAGFVCDVSGGSPAVPRVLPTCAGNPLGPVQNADGSSSEVVAQAGMTEGGGGETCPGGPLTPAVNATISVIDGGSAGSGAGPYTQTGGGNPTILVTQPAENVCSVQYTIDAGSELAVPQFDGYLIATQDLTGPTVQAAFGVAPNTVVTGPVTSAPLPDGTTITVVSGSVRVNAGSGAAFSIAPGDPGLPVVIRYDFPSPTGNVRLQYGTAGGASTEGSISNLQIAPTAVGAGGSWFPTGPNPALGISFTRDPNADENSAICSIQFRFDGNTGDDPNEYQARLDGGDVNGNAADLDNAWIASAELAGGITDGTPIPAGTLLTGTNAAGNVITVQWGVPGETNNFALLLANGTPFYRQNDGDGLPLTVTVTYSIPVVNLSLSLNVVAPSPGSVSGFRTAQTHNGVAAIPAVPASNTTVKQFRNSDGSSFYENLDGTPHAVVGTIGDCGDTFSEVLCDSPTFVPFVRVYKVSNGAIQSFQDYTLAGAPYAVVGVASICTPQDDLNTANIYANCAATPKAEFVGPNAVRNGNFEQATGSGATSALNTGVSTAYAPAADVTLVADTYAIFDTNLSAVTGGLVILPPLSGKSFVAQSSGAALPPIVALEDIELVNGKSYRITGSYGYHGPVGDSTDWGNVGFLPNSDQLSPLGVLPAPGFQDGWLPFSLDFTWTNPSITDTVILGQSGQNPGSILWLDNLSIQEFTPASTGTTTPVIYSETVKAVLEQVVFTEGCNDDRRDNLLSDVVEAINDLALSAEDAAATAATPVSVPLCDVTQVPALSGAREAINLPAQAAGPSGGLLTNGVNYSVDQGSWNGSTTWLINPAPATQTWGFDQVVSVRFGINNLNVGAESVTLPIGTVVESINANHVYNPLTRVLTNGGAALGTDESIFTFIGNSLPVASNPGGGGLRGLSRVEVGLTALVDVSVPFLRTFCRECGDAAAVTDTTLDGVTPYVPTGTVQVCSGSDAETCTSCESILLCDTPASINLVDDWAGSTIAGNVVTNSNFAAAGAVVKLTTTTTPPSLINFAGDINANLVGAVGAGNAITLDLGAERENVTLRFNYLGTTGGEALTQFSPAFDGISGQGTATGLNTGVVPTTADGTVVLTFAGPVRYITFNEVTTGGGQSGLGQITFDVPQAPVGFLRTICRDCDGVVVSTSDATLSGVPYTVVGAVGGCFNDTPPAVGSVTLAPITLNSQSRLLGANQIWTPGADVVGTATSVGFVVISGSASVTDSNGTVAAGLPAGFSYEWSVQDNDTLVPPNAITAGPASSVFVGWVQR